MTKGGIALRGVGAAASTSRRLRSVFLDKIDRIPSFDIQYSIFCGSLFDPAKSHMSAAAGLKSDQFNRERNFGLS
jgi:hypothetical protein